MEPPSAPGAAVSGPLWLISGSALADLQATAGVAFVRQYLGSARTTVLVGRRIPPQYESWPVHFAYDFRSVSQLQAALSQGLAPGVSELLYDPEHWPYTPLAEQVDVPAAAGRAALLAEHAGLGLIVAPATDLAEVLEPGRPVAPAFLSSGVLPGVSAAADAVEIQAQGMESDPALYAAYVREAAAQIRSANPRVELFSGLSTNPSGKAVTVGELLRAVSLTRDVVSGYWLNIPSGGAACPRCGKAQPQVAVSLLRDLAGGAG